ncbi:unnamed protein product [Leptosia nina]|uniref:Androgen-dependent TFPI-regulating protein n=1 Tax=Leptosia nina TaxID=320188 RepID=A0AAV1JIE8_9NEOP
MISDSLLPIRLAGNALLFTAHVINIIVMHLALQDLKDINLIIFKSLKWKYITIWNLAFQNIYLLGCIACDLSTMFKIFDSNLFLKEMKRYRTTYFAAVLWPTSLVASVLSWPIFFYNRELVFPSYIDKVLSLGSNHMIHSFIILVNAWELVLLPRKRPATHNTNFLIMAVIYEAYFTLMITNYRHTGLWPYPLAYDLYGTIYFPLLMLGILILQIFSYFIQWPLVDLCHGSRKKKD